MSTETPLKPAKRRSGLTLDAGPDPAFIVIEVPKSLQSLNLRYDSIIAVNVLSDDRFEIVTLNNKHLFHIPDDSNGENAPNVYLATSELLEAICQTREYCLQENSKLSHISTGY